MLTENRSHDISLHAQESPDICQEVIKVFHEYEFTMSIHCHTERGWGEAVKGLQQSLLVSIFDVRSEDFVDEMSVFLLMATDETEECAAGAV